jgi:phenylacetate-CoA ligase
MGYASSLYTYAKLANENGLDDVRFKAVVSWGDKMFPHYRSLIEKQFSTEVFDTYGASEGTMIAAECEHHNYHIMTPHVFVEILDNNGKEVSPGEMGYIAVTRLDNFLMPLIRYKIGDLAVKASNGKQCPCGRRFPLLEKIIGRDTDIVYTPGGKALIVHFFTGIFEFIREIEQFQVVQHSLYDIEIRIIPSNTFYEGCLVGIKKEICKKADEGLNIRFSEVNEIHPGPSGKPQIIMSHL